MSSSTTFKALAEICERLAATRSRLQMIDIVADFLKNLNQDEVEPAISMILGRPFPKSSSQTLEISWTTLRDMIRRVTGVQWEVFIEAFSRTGDVGSATQVVFEMSKLRRQKMLFERALTILEVRRSFQSMAEVSGAGSREKKERLVETLLSSVSPVEAKYIVKVFIGDMRTGLHGGLMEQAVAKAFDVPLKRIQETTMVLGDVGDVATVIRINGLKGLDEVGFRVFRPVNLMLAQVADGVADALREHGGTTAFEYKYDGARVQIHKSSDRVRVFSRRLTDVTDSLSDIVELAKTNFKAKEAILEGEVVALDNQGRPIPFQHLMRRFRRVQDVDAMVQKIPLRLYLFDALYIDGGSLVSLPYSERRKVLAENAGEISLTDQLITDDVQAGEGFLRSALDAGHEGLMAKKLDSPYTPGIRGKRWLKIKPVLEPLDLVIVAAEYGYGRRHDWLSDYYLAARDSDTGEFLVLGKTFKGLTDAEIIDMTRRLEQIIVSEEPRRVSVIPKIVVEVLYNEIQRSPTYRSGMALRFARISRVRDDKSAMEADTIQRVREIYERQFLKKGRYKVD
jgi:DNA ligase-1